jgi:hypothetical protein
MMDKTLAKQFQHIIASVLRDDLLAARQQLARVDTGALAVYRQIRLDTAAKAQAFTRQPQPAGRVRRSMETTKLSAFADDHWICRFCGTHTIDLRVLKHVSAVCPEEFPYHSNWKFGASHLAYWTHSTSLEHLVPFSRGGADDESNFVTTCYGCNDARADHLIEELGWGLQPRLESGWQGLTEHLSSLRQVTGKRF